MSGTPSTAGEYDTSFRAIYSDGSQAFQAYDFTILSGLPEITLTSTQLVGSNALQVSYEVTATGGDDPTVYLVADTTDQGKDLYKWEYRKNLGKIGLGSGTFTLDGLDADKLYYLRLNAINSVGEDWTGKDSRVRLQPETSHLPMNLGLWLDATDVLANGSDPVAGVTLSQWRDKSPFGRHMDNARGDPTLLREGHGGAAVVDFDGNDHHHGPLTVSVVTTPTGIWVTWAFGVSRYTEGANNRVITSVGTNWLMGHHGNQIARFYLNGWVYTGYGADRNFHLWGISHEGRDQNNDPMGTVFVDGIQVAQNRSSAWWGFYPGQVSFGAYNEMAEASNSQVAEFMMILSSIEDSERHLVEGYLAHKWGSLCPPSTLGHSIGPPLEKSSPKVRPRLRERRRHLPPLSSIAFRRTKPIQALP